MGNNCEMLLSCSEMRALEERAFAEGVTAEELMEEAGRRIADAVVQFFPSAGRCAVVFGKGHNGGDALVAARHLSRRGWTISLRPAFPDTDWTALTKLQHSRLGPLDGDASHRPLVVLDGLLGIGAGGALRNPILAACRDINRMRLEGNAHVFALDLPTGLDGDTGVVAEGAVVADFTLTIGCAKPGLLADGAINHVGRLAVLPLAELSKRLDANRQTERAVATPSTLSGLLTRRNFDTHKGQAGRVGIVAGSIGTVGAAVMCAAGAVVGGAGLVTLHVPRDIYSIVASRAMPEVMVRPVDSPLELLEGNYQAVAIGPGIGLARTSDVLDVIVQCPAPAVVDADGLNCLATNVSALERAAAPRLLTPHPGEMARLDPESANQSRGATVERFIQRSSHALLLKGARTIVAQRGYPLSYNSTGHPGLATGGVGDVMSGLLAALIGQGLTCYDAARIGSWVIGRAAERAIYQGHESAESLTATKLLGYFGQAFTDLRSGAY
jgi:ADP-dependent NAD(P)H-hydrate dehydratase / NAD(P)H-hydrate epimerase